MKPLEELAVELTARFVRIPSVTGSEEKLAQELLGFLKGLGVEAWIDECGNVIAKIGSGRPALLLNGHLDTVPPCEGWTRNPFEPSIEGDRLYGLGASDMKGGLAAMVAAFADACRGELKGTLWLAATVGEEGGERWGAEYLVKEGCLKRERIDYIIVGEPTATEGEIAVRIGHNGIANFKVSFAGIPAHSSRPHLGVNAIYRAADFVKAIERLNAELKPREIPHVTKGRLIKGAVSVTMIRGGIKLNIIPGLCEVYVNRRIVYGESIEQVIEEIKRIAEALNEAHRKEFGRDDLDVKVEVIGRSRPPYFLDLSDPRGRELLDACIEACAGVLGHKPDLIYGTGYTDAEILSTLSGAPAVIIGPGEVLHVPDEYVSLKKLKQAARIYRGIIGRLLG